MNSRPMSDIDKQALREAAEKAISAGDGNWMVWREAMQKYPEIFTSSGHIVATVNGSFSAERSDFIAAANPATVLALLDELEAKDKRLNEILTPNMLLPVIDEMDVDNLRHVIKTASENYSLLHAKWVAAEKRIAELTEKPIGWTDEQELRDVEKLGCGYLFNANPITPNADPRRVILLYAAAAGKGE